MILNSKQTRHNKSEPKITQKEIDTLVADKKAFFKKLEPGKMPTPKVAKEFQALKRRVQDVLRRY
ncbi:hypothetical protein GO013_13220 [Pseudodesulfovibrio sp. JC047]|uniref:hypothetical protein n=1 Tax=Pseudodesulfovibrio sp. JC047 TaxID=2683199 RepID=UPI0013CFF791|nr:hypothetical protein [Pseudodesulfovibrio sp. JC047]NDV20371.1 hypothetical protein [Pseudodesulfovibrio sp. JC047]